MKKIITIAALAAVLAVGAQAKTVYESDLANYVHKVGATADKQLYLKSIRETFGFYKYKGTIKGILANLREGLGLLPTKNITVAGQTSSTSFSNEEILGAFVKYEKTLTNAEIKRLKLFLMMRTSGFASWGNDIKADITNPVTHKPFKISKDIVKHASFGRYLLFLESRNASADAQIDATANGYNNVNLSPEFAVLIGGNGSSEFLFGSEDPAFNEFVGYVVTNQYSKATKLLNDEILKIYTALPYSIATSKFKAYMLNENGKAINMVQAQTVFLQEFLSDLL